MGGLAAHVDGLSRALVRAGHEVVVLTLHHPDVPDDSVVEGVHVLRARTDLPWLPDDNFLAKMSSANHKVVQLTTALDGWRPDLVHAHDWLVAWAGDDLRALWDVPFIATIHATEKGRQGGSVPPGQPSGIHSTEWWLTFQANSVITCSEFMRREVVSAFDLPPAKVHMVPNGVDASLWEPPPPAPARGTDGPLVISWGRVQYEKGFQTLVAALPLLRFRHPRLRVVIAGRGTHLGELEAQAQRLGVDHMIRFPGFVPDDELRHLLHTCSAAVIPSLYEPFGIVALEALAAGSPLVAAAAGGLVEVLDGTGAGLLFPPGDVDGLARALERMLAEPDLVTASHTAGQHLVHDVYSWDAVAAATVPQYQALLASASSSPSSSSPK
ncbi:MAG TPA: glycosyltransferase family 4 protein [Acidimicrobiales bacterium]